MSVLVSMTFGYIFTIVLYSNDHEHMLEADIILNVSPQAFNCDV